jgi:hypothetical protein
MKKHKKLTYAGVIILCAISLFFFLPEKNVIDAPSVARIYEFPKDALIVMDVTEQEKAALRDETENRSKDAKDARKSVAVIAAYEIVPKVPFTFYPVRIVITTVDKFSDNTLRAFKKIEEARMRKDIPEGFVSFFTKYEKLLKCHTESDDSKSGVYFSKSAVMSKMNDDGSFSPSVSSEHYAFIFENHNEKKKYSFRIIHSMQMIRSSGFVAIKSIEGGKKYYAEWYYPEEETLYFGPGLAKRVDFNYIFESLKEATINHIEETGVVEKFYAKRAAEKTQQPPAPKP